MDFDAMKKEATRSDTGRQRVLHKALEITGQDRNKAYGNPEDNFQNIAEVWQWYLQERIQDQNKNLVLEGIDVAHMMSLMKYARLKTNRTHEDSIVDVAGYAACAGDFIKPPAAAPHPAQNSADQLSGTWQRVD